MVDVFSLAEQDTQLHKASVREQAGPCPDPSCRCKTDGFRVKWNGEKWVFMCRGCWDCEEYLADKDRKRGWGDEIDYLRHYRKMTFQQARAFLAGQDDELEQPRRREPIQLKEYLATSWQEKTGGTMKKHIDRLWCHEDTTALDYARRRGLTDEVIRKAKLGYSVKDDIPRLMIPSINDGRYVAIYRRDLRPDISPKDRWKDAPGGTKSELYMADCLKRKLPTVLCEDALSALSVWQESGDLVNAVATGGVTCAQEAKWIARLARMPLVLVALDADQDGDENAKWWTQRLPNARRLRPLLKDINDMLMDDWDIRAWIEQELQETNEALLCSVCGVNALDDDAFSFDENGVPLCGVHHASRHQIPVGPDELKDIAEQMAAIWPGGCIVSEPIQCRPADYIAKCKAELDEEARLRWEEQPPTPESYWARTRRALTKAGYYETVARDNELLQARMQRYRESWLGSEASENVGHLDEKTAVFGT